MSQQQSPIYTANGRVYLARVHDDGGAVQVLTSVDGNAEGSITLQHADYMQKWNVSDEAATTWLVLNLGPEAPNEIVEWVDWTLFAMVHPKRRGGRS